MDTTDIDRSHPKLSPKHALLIVCHAQTLGEGGVLWDSATLTPWYKYSDPTRSYLWWEGYFDDARSLALKYELVHTHRLRGVLIWMLNGCTRTEAPTMWQALDKAFGPRRGLATRAVATAGQLGTNRIP